MATFIQTQKYDIGEAESDCVTGVYLTKLVSVLQLCALAQNFDKILVIKDIAKLIIKFSFSGE